MKFNEKQELILKISVGIIAIMLIFPPFHMTHKGLDVAKGYFFILTPPDRYSGVDGGMLLLQWFAVALISAMLVYLSRDPD